jgi:hypothetical protein
VSNERAVRAESCLWGARELVLLAPALSAGRRGIADSPASRNDAGCA